MITLDTSGVLALQNRADSDHGRGREALERESQPLVLPVGILADAC